ncbi:class II aldolase/adducin family protein [Piscinibacter sp. XHJ-5]|uniref:class II aldolase/adducin family protein n=1 Tax=Piscinibacter sp. XHJ-5 TaxID=3037797 RepID=UPI0024532FE2|nr:class II aldolase/adducin family protein [Piscinibacter sp. XHJ-5]
MDPLGPRARLGRPSMSEHDSFSPASDLRHRLAAAYRHLSRLGLNSGSAGNVSCRLEDGALVTPTGASAETIDAASLVEITLDGETRGPGIPSSEWAMHTEIYRRYPQAQAIVHTHSDACVALACLRSGIPAFHYMIATFGGDDVRCAPYATFGTETLARLAADALVDRSACLLANHGMIGWGADIEQAIATATRLETLARQYWMSLQVGPPVLLDPQEMRIVRDRFRAYGSTRLATRLPDR